MRSSSTGPCGGAFSSGCPLAPPSRRALAGYVEQFADSLDEPFGHSPEAVAQGLGAISFAEAEEFCRDVRRRQVLAMGDVPVRQIVAERLAAWRRRANA